MPTARLLTASEAAEYLGTTPRHVRRLAEQRKITTYYVGRWVRFLTDDLDDYLRRNRREAQ